MRKLLSFLLVSIALIAPLAKADTIHLKNGSILKGKVASFADDQFVVMLDTGSGRYMSRAMVYIGDVAKIEFDSVPGAGTEGAARETTHTAQPADPAPRIVISQDQPRSNPSSEPPPCESLNRCSRKSPLHHQPLRWGRPTMIARPANQTAP
jgi:hypothetical protein